MNRYQATTSGGIIYTITVHDDGRVFMKNQSLVQCSLANAAFLISHKYSTTELRTLVKEAALKGVIELTALTGLYWKAA